MIDFVKAPQKTMSPDFLTELAQPRPDPGGGAAAAYSARVALGLITKLAKLEHKRARPGGDEFWRDVQGKVQKLA